MNWTDERIEILKRLWADGLSASQIAAELGGCTRNAVIGKVHRLGLSGRAKASVAPGRPRRPRQKQYTSHRLVHKARGAAALALAFAQEDEEIIASQNPEILENIIPFGQRCSLQELNETTCRWPVGDPQSFENFYFCGGPPIAGHPYCAYHSRVAYQPPAPRRDRRPVRG